MQGGKLGVPPKIQREERRSRIMAMPEPPGPSTRRSGLTISEIMYHPKSRPDGKQLEFIEIYNSLPIWEDLTDPVTDGQGTP